MTKLEQFWVKLNKYEKTHIESFDVYGDRVNWCHLLARHNGELHRFEVRGARFVKDYVDEAISDVITLSVVNWTLCAGTATLSLCEANVGDFLIEEDEPTVGLLYVQEK